MSGILYPDESYKIIGACFNVYKAMGCGFLENVYQECLEIEFDVQKIPFESHKAQVLNYLNASGLNLGILVNFGHYPKLEYERFVLTREEENL